jgi:hypothetical protein
MQSTANGRAVAASNPRMIIAGASHYMEVRVERIASTLSVRQQYIPHFKSMSPVSAHGVGGYGCRDPADRWTTNASQPSKVGETLQSVGFFVTGPSRLCVIPKRYGAKDGAVAQVSGHDATVRSNSIKIPFLIPCRVRQTSRRRYSSSGWQPRKPGCWATGQSGW